MYNPGEAKGFYLKSSYLRPLSNFFMNVVQLPVPDLPLGTVPEAPRSNGKIFLSLYLYLAGRCCDNSQSTRGPAYRDFGPDNNMVSRRNHLLYHFSITIHLHLASF